MRPSRYARFFHLSGFIQDEYKVSPEPDAELRTALGLQPAGARQARHHLQCRSAERATGRAEPDHHRQYVNPLFPRAIPIVTASAAGFPERSLRQGDFNNFQPRVGLAWRPFGGSKTVIRGGYGFFNDDFTADIFSALYGGPFSLTESFVNTITNNTPALTLQRPFLGAGTTGNVDVTGLD